MKRFFILSVLSLLLSTIHSQTLILKKDILLGGALSISTNNSSGGNVNSNTNLNPRIGYAIGNNSLLSLRFGFYTNYTRSPYGDSRSFNFSAGISWKKFFAIKERFGWYTDLYGSAVTGYTKPSPASATAGKTTNMGLGAGINPGIYYAPLPRLIVNADFGGIAYGYSKNTSAGTEDYHTSAVNVNFLNYFSFGIDFILTKRKS